MRRAKLEGRHIGRKPLDIDRQAILRDRDRGLSLAEPPNFTAYPGRASPGSSKALCQKGSFHHRCNSMKTGRRKRRPDLRQKVWLQKP